MDALPGLALSHVIPHFDISITDIECQCYKYFEFHIFRHCATIMVSSETVY